MLWLASSLKLIAEIALMAMLGQFVLGLLAGEKRERNLVYNLLQVLTAPFQRFTRMISPRVVIDRHIPLATFCLLVSLWLFSTAAKISACMQIGIEQCK
jgi:hypothetical protein